MCVSDYVYGCFLLSGRSGRVALRRQIDSFEVRNFCVLAIIHFYCFHFSVFYCQHPTKGVAFTCGAYLLFQLSL